MGVRPQDGRQQRALAAADVRHGPHRREVISGGDARRERRGPLRHRGLEPLRQVRVHGEELEDTHPVRDVEAGLARLDRLDDGLERPDTAERLHQHRPRPH